MVLPLVVAGLNAVGGVLAGRAAKKSSKAMSGYYAESAASLRRNREIGNELYGKYQQKYEPLESDIIDMARTEWNPDYAGVLRRATGDYTRARNQTRDEAMRTYNRMGVDPSNPMYMRGINRTQISDALALSTARNMAREAERTRAMSGKFSAMSNAFNMGANIPGAVIGANTGVASGMAGMGSAYGQMAGANAGAAGYFMNQAFNQLPGVVNSFRSAPVSGAFSGFQPGAVTQALGYQPSQFSLGVDSGYDPNFKF